MCSRALDLAILCRRDRHRVSLDLWVVAGLGLRLTRNGGKWWGLGVLWVALHVLRGAGWPSIAVGGEFRHEGEIIVELLAEVKLVDNHQSEEDYIMDHANVMEDVDRLVELGKLGRTCRAQACPHEDPPHGEAEMKRRYYHSSRSRALSAPRKQ